MYLSDLDDDIWDEYNEGMGGTVEEEEDYVDIPSGSLLGNMAYNPQRDEGGLGDVTLADIADDYSFPLEFIFDVLCRWGVPPPIKPEDKLGLLVNGEQAYAVVEALTSVDPATIHEFYLEETLEELSFELEVPLSKIFAVCGKHRFNLPLGAETHLSNPEYRTLLKELGFEGELEAIAEQQRLGQGRVKENDLNKRAHASSSGISSSSSSSSSSGSGGGFLTDTFADDFEDLFGDDESVTISAPGVKPFVI